MEMPLRTQTRVQAVRTLVRPIITKKDHQRQLQQQQHLHQQQQQQQQQNNIVSNILRPLTDVMQKSGHNEKEVSNVSLYFFFSFSFLVFSFFFTLVTLDLESFDCQSILLRSINYLKLQTSSLINA